MLRVALSSSTVRSVGYDRSARTLEVEFTSGQVYRYFGVPEVHYRALVNAPSPGSYLNARIRDAYRYERL